MKKILVASTALLLTAGAAAAEVTVGGNGRMGVHYDGQDWNFTSRIRVTFTLSGSTDSGLSFGGSIRADNAAGGANGSAGSIFISGAFGKLSMGDVDSAAEVAAGNISGVGLTGLGDPNDTWYFADNEVPEQANDPQALYEYTMGGFTFAVSGKDGNGAIGGRGIGGHAANGRVFGIGVKYSGQFSGGSFTAGLGYEHVEDTFGFNGENIVVGGSVTFGDATVKAMYQSDTYNDIDGYGISLDYKFTPATATVFFRGVDYGGGFEEQWIGLGAAYDLGAGAVLRGGVVFVDSDFTGEECRADFGIALNF